MSPLFLYILEITELKTNVLNQMSAYISQLDPYVRSSKNPKKIPLYRIIKLAARNKILCSTGEVAVLLVCRL